MLNSDGLCDVTLCSEYLYNNVSNVCGRDNRPTQLTAFLITLFAGSTGAANFYIGQGGLGEINFILYCTCPLILSLLKKQNMCAHVNNISFVVGVL